MANTLYPQIQALELYSSGANVGDTSVVFSAMNDIDGNPLSMSNFGPKGRITLDPGAGTSEEQISFTGLTQNANGTATITGVKSVLCVSPYTETSGLTKPHSGGATAVVAVTSGLLNELANKGNDETITGTYTFTSTAKAKYNAHPTFSADEELIDKKYADDLAIAGSPDASTTVKGIIELATNAEMGSGTSTGGTGARLVPPNDQLVKTSSGTGDENKIPVLNASGKLADGFLDAARTWSTVQSFTANNCQITTDADSANDAVRQQYLDKLFYGDSSDGALSINSGTTTINTAGKRVYRYSSFSVTGTASFAVGSNLASEQVVILVNGDLTITSAAAKAINCDGRGLSAGRTNWRQYATAGGNGTAGAGGGGGGGGGGAANAAGTAGTASTGGTAAGAASAAYGWSAGLTLDEILANPRVGAGGGNGGDGSGAGGAGGAGGGSIIFIVRGNVSISGTLSALGANGTNGTSGGTGGAGGGGGGGGGFIGIYYVGTLANTATITVTGGTGGSAGTGSGQNGGAGGTGGAGTSEVRQISAPFALYGF